ncbi:MAG: hypothetical protein J0I20_09500 [Chloroflexi bacterium]|nr:hypothetical protein [Chloroflexota bacterium]OJV94656.1 MAG: hypothetical protein BGO39_23315 [Chloroflexi bacterium 54-19]
MKDWRALPSKGGLIGIIFTGVAAVIFGLAVWITVMAATATEVVQAVQSPDADPDTPAELLTVPTGNNIGTFFLVCLCVVLLLVVLYLAYQTRKFFALRYSLDRNAIRVNLGDSQQVIPLANVRYMLPAEVVIARAKERGQNAADLGASAGTARAGAATDTRAESSARSTGSSTRPYPRKAPPPQAPEPDLDEEMVEVEIAEPDADRPYQMTQTAAADSDLEYLEAFEIETAEFVEISEAGTEPVINPARPESDDYEERPAQVLNPREMRALAINFDDEEQDTKGQAGDGGEKTTQSQTEAVTTATEIESDQVTRRPFSSWPGFYLNKSKVPALGVIQFYSTRPVEGTLLIRTNSQTYAISPRDRQQFITEFNLRKRLGAIEPVQEGINKGPLLSHPLWHDNLGRGLIALGIILNMFIYFSMLLRYNDFPDILRIHFNKVGQVDRLGDRSELMFLPLIGLVTIIANDILGAFVQLKEAIPAYLLYAAGVLLQVLVGIALVVILIVS